MEQYQSQPDKPLTFPRETIEAVTRALAQAKSALASKKAVIAWVENRLRAMLCSQQIWQFF